jgi:hypothetical protein
MWRSSVFGTPSTAKSAVEPLEPWLKERAAWSSVCLWGI